MTDVSHTLKQPLSLRPTNRLSDALLPTTLALGVTAALLGNPLIAKAEPQAAKKANAQVMKNDDEEEENIVLDKLQVKDRTSDTNPYTEAGAPYKAKVSGDKRHVKPLAETPQTISVITQTQIQDAGKYDLREILRAQPGVTLGTGENGNAFGDRYIIRGQEIRSDMFVDGVRDPGMTIRESFAVEQLEITKGPSSTFAGRGSTGGAVNSITKQASTDYNFNKLQAGYGSDDYRRFTIDSNYKINEDLAVRANLLHAYKDIPDREPANRERNGAALSAVWQASDRLKFTGDFYYLKANDTPDLGSYIRANGGGPNNEIPVYLQNEDFLSSEIKAFTLRTEFAFNDSLRLENIARYANTENGYVATGARGVNRNANDPYAPNAATISLSTHQGWQEVDYFVDRLNLYWDNEILGTQNKWLFSAEFSQQDVLNGNYTVQNAGASNCLVGNGTGTRGYCIIDANGNTVSNINNLMQHQISKGGLKSDYSMQTTAISVMDTIDFTKDISAFFGVRMDCNNYSNDVTAQNTVTHYSFDDDLWNYHAGLVYKFTPDVNVYFTYGTAADVNGGESDVGANCGYGGLCGVPSAMSRISPERSENFELGTKWNVFNNKLLLTAALFQISKSDVMESVGSAYSADGALNTGGNEVRGIEFSAVGNITDQLSAQFGAAVMTSEITDSYLPANIGKKMSNFAEDSTYLQLKYQLTPKFSIGGTLAYSSEMYTGQPDTAAGYDATTGVYSYKIPSFITADLFAAYKITDHLKLSANFGNITDKYYYLAGYRSGAFAYIGDRRYAQFTLSYDF